MTEPGPPAEPGNYAIADVPGVRNAWQWLAMLTMTLDHIGFLYPAVEFLRYPGRLGMPLYAILFVVTIQKHQIHLRRILILAFISQIPYQYIFQLPHLNIIFGFAIFAWTAEAIRQHNRLKAVVGLLMMLIPVSYGWYLYGTLAIFYFLDNKRSQRSSFFVLTAVYTYISSVNWRQMLAVAVPFLTWLKAPRPNKYLYRYFYPGHLAILAVIYTLTTAPVTHPPDKPYHAPDGIYCDDANKPDMLYDDRLLYDMDAEK